MYPAQPGTTGLAPTPSMALPTRSEPLMDWVNRVIDKRTATGKALAKWRANSIADLGGDDANAFCDAPMGEISPQGSIDLLL